MERKTFYEIGLQTNKGSLNRKPTWSDFGGIPNWYKGTMSNRTVVEIEKYK